MRTLLLLVLLIGSQFGFSQGIQLSEDSEISVMTMGAYQPELYSAFGHTAIRVFDPQNNMDYVYNYGVFDFNQKNFYLNFAKGKMIYKLGMAYYEPFRDFYISQDRDVREQVLNLTQDQRQAVFAYLQNNHRPANRDYLYNYVYDNCASKIPDVLNAVVGDKLTYNESYMQPGKTIRDLMHDYLTYQPWGAWAIDIGLGAQIDKVADAKEFMFLPDYVLKALEAATIRTAGGQEALVKEMRVVYTSKNAPEEPGLFTPLNFFVLLFFVGGIITHRNMKSGKRTRWFDGLLFGFAGFAGIWLAFLWIGTAHLSKWNYDLLWAVPFHFMAVFALRKKSWVAFNHWYFKLTAVLHGLVLLSWGFLPEPMHMALVPFTLLLLIRAVYISYDLRRKASA